MSDTLADLKKSIDAAAQVVKESEYIQRKKRRRPLSKTIMLHAFAKEWVIIVATFAFCAIYNDLTPLGFLIPAVFIEIGIEKGFYFTSSKAEKLKHMEMSYNPQYDEENFKEV